MVYMVGKCPECGEGDVVRKFSRKRKMFFSCNRYPECKFSAWDKPLDERCPECGGKYLVERTTKKAGPEKRCPEPECGFREAIVAAEASADETMEEKERVA